MTRLATGDIELFGRLQVLPPLLERAGVRRVTDAEARERLGVTKNYGDCAGILFPRVDPRTGHEVGYRVRRDSPEIERGKAVNKYLSSVDRLHLYFPPDVAAHLINPSVPAIFVESEKSALALLSLSARIGRSWLVIGTGGCWGWRGRVGKAVAANGARVDELGPSADLDFIVWADRLALVLFDGDSRDNPSVRGGRTSLMAVIGAKGARAKSVDLPVSASINGPDDFLRESGDRALVALLDAAVSTNGHHATRGVRLLPASSVVIRPVKWLWQDRIALGALALIGGREGVGKSLVAYTLAADLSKGRLAGIYAGTPKSIIIVATEDSWSHTIVPRLMAADADLDRIFRVDVHTPDGESIVTLPADLPELDRVVRESDVGLILLDPLLSRLASTLDTHKDSDVRKALEPLVALADATGAAVVGLIHVTKSASTDALTLLMGSRAFAAVARAVLFVMLDPDDQSKRQRLLGQAKNNLGRMDLPTLQFAVDGYHVATTDEGEIWTGKLAWTGESERLISEALVTAADTHSGDAPMTNDAIEWLRDYLDQHGGSADSKPLKQAAKRDGHQIRTLHRARERLGATVLRLGSGSTSRTVWTLPPPAVSGSESTDSAEF